MLKTLLVSAGEVVLCSLVFIIAVMVGTILSSILYPMGELATEVHITCRPMMLWAL